MLSSFLKIGTDGTKDDDEVKEPLECNYDTDLITLYQALEEQAWIPALDIIETDSQESRDQIRTWVTRYEKTGAVRWSQLPIHAAMIFKAPYKIVKALVEAYPAGVRCTDDQHMLPLHLAFRYGAPDNTLLFLLEAFPEAMNAKNNQERVPALCACPESPYRSKIVRYHIDNAKQLLLEDRPMAKEVAELEGKLEEQMKRTEELEAEKEAWTAREAELKEEISELEKKLAAKNEVELKQEISKSEETLAAKKEVELKQEVAKLEDKLVAKQELKLQQEISKLVEKLALTPSKEEVKEEISKLEEKLAAKKEAEKEKTREESVSVETILEPPMELDNTSVKSIKSSKSMRFIGSKILHLGSRKGKPKEAEVNPAEK